jgi:DNA/RNA endonuclease YhcR with UshA esterase domain
VVFDYRLARALVLACIVAPVCAAAAGPTYIPIVTARVQPQGTTVAVMGLVTVSSGNFQSSSADEGFAVQDQTAGIWISVKKNLKLKVGQRVRVSGTLGESFGKLQIVPKDVADVEALPGGKLRVATGQVGKATLGYLISVEGTITQDGVVDDLPYGYKIFLNDGSGVVQVFLSKSTKIDPRALDLKPGRQLRATGFGSQYNTTYEVEPRSRRDLEPLSR